MASSTPVQKRAQVPSATLNTPYPLIDCDPYVQPHACQKSSEARRKSRHFKRVVGYARTSDYVKAAAIAAIPPGGLLAFERWQPSGVGKGGFAPVMRMNVAIGLVGGFLWLCTKSSSRFYGMSENKREQEMDMREMVDKVRKGEPLYGKSELTPHMQGVAARNSRYSGLFLYTMPWFNFVNHDQHGVDTAKYYLQAERELEAEKH